MALNAERVGFRYAPYRYEVGHEAVRAYARATQVADGRYYDDRPAALGQRLAVPPAFIACAAGARAWTRIIDDPELGAHERLMHVGQEFDFERPVHVGDVLVCTPTITDIKALRGVELLTLEVGCATTDGAPAVTSRSRLVFFEDTT